MAMALAALSLAWGISLDEGLIAAMVGAVLGVVVGEFLGRSRLRLVAVLVGTTIVLGVCWKLAAIATTTETLPAAVGPGNTLVFASVIRLGTLAFALTTALRTLALRRPAAMALELAFVTVALTTVFASHRDGVISRPLWLSDWAWQQGYDPATVLLAIGAGAVGLLAVLLIAESRSGRALSSIVALALLAVTAVLFINVVGPPTSPSANDLGLTDAGTGRPPHPTDAGRQGGPENPGDGGRAGHGNNHGDGGSSRGPDASPDDGGGTSGLDGSTDGGGSSGQPDGGDGSAGTGDGTDGASLPPPSDDGGIGQAPPPQDGGSYRPPPSSERLSEDQQPNNSPAPMAVVLFDDDYSPPSGAYYFRQEAWSEYNGTRLVTSNRTDVDLDIEDDFPTAVTPVQEPPPTFGRTRVRGTVAVLVEHTHPFALESPVTLAPAVNPNPTRFLRAWHFDSLAQSIDYRRLIGRAGGDHHWTRDVRQYYLQGPSDPRYAALAHQIVNQRLPVRLRSDPFAEAVAVQLYLNHELIYSTRRRHNTTADPTADFLFGDRTGYCVHFAHSAVFLWRALGIPSRISAGYHSDESNRRGGSALLLRGGDAHAWPEMYVDGVGWIVLDIAAERNLDPPGTPPDADLQRLLGEMARQTPPEPDVHTPGRMPRRVPHHLARHLGRAVLYALAGVLVALYLTKLWRRVIPRLVSPRRLPRVAYRKVLDQLAEAGLARHYGESREAFAQRVGAIVPSFVRVTELHVGARLGRPPEGDVTHHDAYSTVLWRSLFATVRHELSSTVPRWRRVLGLLHPASFLDAR